MNFNNSNILAIILGILAICFPILFSFSIGLLCGVLFFIISLWIIVAGISAKDFSINFSFLVSILGIIMLLFSIELLVNPPSIAEFTGFLIYLIGLVLIIYGLISFFTVKIPLFKASAVISIIMGLFTFIFGYLLKTPTGFGIFIGVWLLINGIISLFKVNPEDKYM